MPIILAPESPVSTREELQKLAEIPSLPEVIDSDQLEGYEDKKTAVRRVKFCPVSFTELERTEAKAEVVDGVENTLYVMFGGQTRFAWIVKALKEGVALEDGSGRQDNGSGNGSV